MFTLLQMEAAHAKVKSGADFPAYIREIKQLGLMHYDFLVRNGQIEYHGANGFQVKAVPIYAPKHISAQASITAVRQIIAEHQQGNTDFLTFCQQVADAGVEKWIVDTQAMVCIYFDAKGNSIVTEPIPQNAY